GSKPAPPERHFSRWTDPETLRQQIRFTGPEPAFMDKILQRHPALRAPPLHQQDHVPATSIHTLPCCPIPVNGFSSRSSLDRPGLPGCRKEARRLSGHRQRRRNTIVFDDTCQDESDLESMSPHSYGKRYPDGSPGGPASPDPDGTAVF